MQTTYKSATDLTLDLTGQVLTAPLVFNAGGRNISIKGGTMPGIVANDVDGLTVTGATILPPAGKVGVMIRGGVGHVVDCDITGGLNSIVFLDADGGSVIKNRCSQYGGDGLHLFGAQGVYVLYNRFFDSLNDGVHHGDAIQLHNTLRRCADLLIARNEIDHMGQGIDNMDDGEAAWMDRIRIEFNRIAVGSMWAINAHHCRDSRVVGNEVVLKPGGLTGTRKVPVRSTKVQVGPGVTFDGNTLSADVDVLKAAA